MLFIKYLLVRQINKQIINCHYQQTQRLHTVVNDTQLLCIFYQKTTLLVARMETSDYIAGDDIT